MDTWGGCFTAIITIISFLVMVLAAVTDSFDTVGVYALWVFVCGGVLLGIEDHYDDKEGKEASGWARFWMTFVNVIFKTVKVFVFIILGLVGIYWFSGISIPPTMIIIILLFIIIVQLGEILQNRR